MALNLTQESSEFLELGMVSFERGSEITFKYGLFEAHSHGRDNNKALGAGMTDVLSHSASQFSAFLLMGNLAGADALTTPQKAINYYRRAQRALQDRAVVVVVTVMLNTKLTRDDIERIASDPRIIGIKFMPAGGSTNSEYGLRTPLDAPEQLQWMQEYGVPLLVHGQTRISDDGSVLDEWDREPYFYEVIAPELDRRYPKLQISYEHISTSVGMEAVVKREGPTQGTLTILHLGYTRTDVMDTGCRTDMVMKPMVQHSRELPKIWKILKAYPGKFALGSDDAWHPITAKHAKNCTCGGCYGPYRIGYYLDVFERNDALGIFGRFACVNGPRFYGIDVPLKTVVVRKGNYTVAKTLPFGKHEAEPLHAGEDRYGWYLVT